MNSASVLVGSDLSTRFLAEEFGDCRLRIAFNDQPFLLGSGFTLSALRLLLFRHNRILSQRFLYGVKVPRSGIGPERPEWARGCKPRLSASSSTGAYNKALIVGTVTPAKTSPVLALFGPISATLKPSSFGSSSKSLERNGIGAILGSLIGSAFLYVSFRFTIKVLLDMQKQVLAGYQTFNSGLGTILDGQKALGRRLDAIESRVSALEQ
jgi:hypothetical protein